MDHLISYSVRQLGVETIFMASNPSVLENIYYGKDRWFGEDICLIRQQHFTLHFQIMPLLENDLLQEQFIKLNTCHYATKCQGSTYLKDGSFSISFLAGILNSKRPREKHN